MELSNLTMEVGVKKGAFKVKTGQQA